MICHLSPAVFYKVWGGSRLAKLKSLPERGNEGPLGETWEISIHPEGRSHYQNSSWSLSENEELPYLVKFIDTGSELSIQVHPDDEYALLHEKSNGKSECWLILAAEKDAGVYLGLKEGVTKESFRYAVYSHADVSSFLNYYPVSPGDFFYVPAGTVHAIGRGITLAEVQQSSGITYRVWDWNRVDSSGKLRPLHIEKSLEVINFSAKANTSEFYKMRFRLFEKSGRIELIEHPSFRVSLFVLEKKKILEVSLSGQKRVRSILNFEESFEINGEIISNYQGIFIRDETKLTIKSFDAEIKFLLIE